MADKIQPSVYAPDAGLHPGTETALAHFLADAGREGIRRAEIEEDMGDLAEFLSAALEAATEAEVDRLEAED